MAEDYYDHYLDLPGGAELARALVIAAARASGQPGVLGQPRTSQ